ncbi:MAG: hypothetical protein HY973_02210 [Candidatus Kerfeldbacteria bacterium]|nr:hypothetical protein [Candidatus Kerfeldbacteria bacterium]
MTTFINTLPYISNPVEEFKNFEFVSWERDIYPKFKGSLKKGEINFFVDIITNKGLKSILDLGVGGGSRDYTKDGIKSIIAKFSQLIPKGGYLFIDTRNFDYIRSLMNLPIKEIVKNFYFDYTVYYHGSQKDIIVFPAYISDTIVVLHYYDIKQKTWSKLDYFPLYQYDMIEILSQHFEIEKIYHDFSEENKQKSIFIQYLARKK